MSGPARASDLAFRVADLVRAKSPWEVVGERSTRYEIHLQGSTVELERGPITVEGYGVRVIRPRGERIGTGFQASTVTSPDGVRAVVEDAEASARHAEFPARTVELPAQPTAGSATMIVDPKLWAEPFETLRTYVQSLVSAFEGRHGVGLSFGSVKAVLSELSLANSSGLKVGFPSTQVELELGVKASGGPEGAPPGEFWVTEFGRRLDPARSAASVENWCRYAADVRRSSRPPTGEQAVVLPPDVLAGILPPVIGFRFTGAARLRKVAPEIGAEVAASRVTIRDEGDYPWAVGSAPHDGEGTPTRAHALIERGAVVQLLYDTLYGAAFSTPSTGSAIRSAIGPSAHLRFAHPPGPGASTVVLAPGDGGSVDELAEAAGDGILVTQLGWAIPDPISGAFGGEIRIGYRIRGGKIAEPVRGGTVGGTVLGPPGASTMLRNTEAIGQKVELSDRLAAPPILVRTLTVAGA